NRATYDKLRRWNLYQQVQQQALQDQFSQQTGGGVTDSSALSGLIQQLKAVENETSLDQTTIQSLVDGEVLRQKSASDYQVNPTSEELKSEAKKDFLPSPTAPPSNETPTAVPPTSTPGPPTSTPISSTITPSPTMTQTPTRTATPGTPTSTPTSTATYPPVPGASAT